MIIPATVTTSAQKCREMEYTSCSFFLCHLAAVLPSASQRKLGTIYDKLIKKTKLKE